MRTKGASVNNDNVVYLEFWGDSTFSAAAVDTTPRLQQTIVLREETGSDLGAIFTGNQRTRGEAQITVKLLKA